MSEWIDVNDKVPETEHWVLTYDVNSCSYSMGIKYYSAYLKQWLSGNCGRKVTHWMKLPAPPRKEEEE